MTCSGGRRGRPGRAGDRRRSRRPRRARGRRRPRRRSPARPASGPARPSRSVPPCSRSTEASASVIDCEPPAATGQPTLWQALISAIPTDGAHRPRQRAEGVGGDAAEQRPRRRRLPAAREQRRRRGRRDPEPGQAQRVLRHVQDRPQHVLVAARRSAPTGDPKTRRQARPSSPSPAAVSSIERTIAAGAAVVERVRQVDLRPAPLEPVLLQLQRAQEGRRRRHRVRGRADVVEHARHGQLGAAGAAADRLRGLEHRHLDARPRQRHRAGEPVGAGADDRRRRSRCRTAAAGLVAARPRRRSTSTGKSQRLVQPGLALDHVGDGDRSLLDQPGRGVVDRVALAAAADRLRTPARSPAPRPARTRSAPASPPAAGGRGSGRRRSSSR